MYIVTSNEKNTLTSAERREDVKRIRYGIPTPANAILLWQEIIKPEFHTDIQSQLPGTTYHAHPDLPIPVSVPYRYEVLEERSVQTKEWTGRSGDGTSIGLGPVGDNMRWYGVLRLKDKTRPNLPEFYVINTHFTNGGEWDDTTPSATCLALREYWNTHWDLMKAEIDTLKAADFTVFYGGDFNRQNSPAFGDADRLAVGNGRIDKLGVINRSVSTTLENTGTIQTLSNHNAHWAKWDLSIRP